MLIRDIGPLIWFTLKQIIVNHCSSFKIIMNRPTMWAVFRPQQEHGSHQHWERRQGDVEEWGRRLVSSPLSLSPLSPPWCYSERAQWLTPVSCQSEHCYCLCAQQRGGRGPEVLWSRPKPCSPTLSLSFLYFPLSLLLPPTFYLSFIACVRIQSKGEACMKPSFCYSVSSSVWTYSLKHESSPGLWRPQIRLLEWSRWMWPNFV